MRNFCLVEDLLKINTKMRNLKWHLLTLSKSINQSILKQRKMCGVGFVQCLFNLLYYAIWGSVILWRFKPFLSVSLRVYSYLFGGLRSRNYWRFRSGGKSKKTKAFCGLGRTNYGGLRNVRPPIIDPLIWWLHLPQHQETKETIGCLATYLPFIY